MQGLSFPECAILRHSRYLNYDTNKTHLDEAPFGRDDDDNGPGSEPQPHDRLPLCLGVFYKPPATSGGRRKAGFAYFSVDYIYLMIGGILSRLASLALTSKNRYRVKRSPSRDLEQRGIPGDLGSSNADHETQRK